MLDFLQDEIDEAKRLLEEAHVEVQAAQAKVAEAASRVSTAMEEMAELKSLMETNRASAEEASAWRSREDSERVGKVERGERGGGGETAG